MMKLEITIAKWVKDPLLGDIKFYAEFVLEETECLWFILV